MGDLLKVLMVEDNPSEADVLFELLPMDGSTLLDVKCVTRLSVAFECVVAERFDIILLDLGLPDSDGMATLHTMRRRADKLPIIVLTSINDEQTGLDALREGAQDYLIKGKISKDLLARSIKYAVERIQAQIAFKELNETLQIEIADLKSAAEALRQNEDAKFRLLFENNLDAVFLTFPDGRVLSANPAACAMFGMSEEEIIRVGRAGLSAPNDPKLAAAVAERKKTGQASAVELDYIRKNGQRFPAEVDSVILPGEPQRSFVILRDITDRKQAEDAVRQHNAILEGINEVFAATLTSRTEKDLGDACLEIAQKLTQSKFGFIGDINEQGFEDTAISNPGWETCNIIDPNGHRRPPGNFKIHGIYGRVMSDGKSLFTNDPGKHPDRIGLPSGHPPLEAFLGVPLHREGRVTGLIAVANRPGGYTEVEQETLEILAPVIVEAFISKRAEEALRQSEERFRTLFNTLIEAFCIIELIFDTENRPIDYRYLETNPAFAIQTGLPNVQGKLMSELSSPESAANWSEIYGKVVLTGEPVRFVNEAKTLNRWYDLSAYKIGGPDSRKVAVLFNDITETKRAELALKNSNENLEKRVAERTEELAATINKLQAEIIERERAVETVREKEQMLIQQSRMAAMGEMIGNIAHQWRQPLNLLGLMSQQLLLYYDMGEFNRTFLAENVDKEMALIQHMSKTIDDFRNYFKPDKERVEFRVKDAVTNTLSLLEGSLQNPQISVEVVAMDDPILHGYPNEFAQVLLNLIINAKDVFMEREIVDPTLTITVSSEDSFVVITVADNGGGIPEEIMANIFAPYFTTKGLQGTGVGLFMSKSIIEKNMGGRLTVRNIAKGAEFRIEI